MSVDVLLWHPLTIRLDADPTLTETMTDRQRRILARPVKVTPCKGGVRMAIRGAMRFFASSRELDQALTVEMREHEAAARESLGDLTATGRYHSDRASFLWLARVAISCRAKRLWPQEAVS